MKIYFKKEQFPDALKFCVRNRNGALCSPIEYIPGDKNQILVGQSDEDQMDFSVFWNEIEDYIYYIVGCIREQIDPNYLALLEDFGGGDITEKILLDHFTIKGVEGF